jgi:Tfp pilus assembly PilM family ATPase
MSRLLAFEWDAREARVVVARTTGKSVEVEQAFSVPLAEPAEVVPEGSPAEAVPEGPPAEAGLAELGPRLAAACRERNVGRCQALVTVPRGKIELRLLQVPPAPDEELPELVRFQALRQFTSLGEDWPLDFIPLQSADPQQVRVLAAAVAPAVVVEVRQICEALDSPPTSLVLRPFAAASFFSRFTAADRCRLMVELFVEEADLNVVAGGQVLLLRSVRLPAQNRDAALVGEIRRTLAAARNQLGDQIVEAVMLLGGAAELGSLPTVLRDQLKLEVESFDPLDGAQLTAEARRSLADRSGRFAALLGMVYDEAEERRHGIDFLKPRQRPLPPSRGRRYTAVAAAAAAVLLLLGGLIAWQIQGYSRRVAELQTESKNLDNPVKAAEQLRAEVAVIDAFAAGDVNWLDELYGLSQKFPNADEALVDVVTFSTRTEGGGLVYLEGYVRDPAIIEKMESKLRDARRQVTGSGTTFDERQPEYRWQFKERIVILPPEQEEAVDE